MITLPRIEYSIVVPAGNRKSHSSPQLGSVADRRIPRNSYRIAFKSFCIGLSKTVYRMADRWLCRNYRSISMGAPASSVSPSVYCLRKEFRFLYPLIFSLTFYITEYAAQQIKGETDGDGDPHTWSCLPPAKSPMLPQHPPRHSVLPKCLSVLQAVRLLCAAHWIYSYFSRGDISAMTKCSFRSRKPCERPALSFHLPTRQIVATGNWFRSHSARSVIYNVMILLILDSPRDDNDEPVVPSSLLDYVENRGWGVNPNCFCAIRGHRNRIAVLYVPRKPNSPAFQQVCLVCPEYECPYFGMFGIYQTSEHLLTT